MTRPWYVTRERLKDALDMAETARRNAAVDEACEAGTDAVDRLCRRTFSPWTGTRYFDWPTERDNAESWVLRMSNDLGRPPRPDLISATTVTAAGTAIAAADRFLRPDDGPPYTRIEIDLESSADWGSDQTHQRAISVLGVWGYSDDQAAAGALAEALDDSETGVDITDASLVGVGDLLVCESERMIVTGRGMLDTGQDLTDALTDSDADVTTGVASGAALNVGEVVLVDAEKIRVDEIAGNTLTITRAMDGTVLASHLVGASVYSPRTLTVVRGAQGSTAAAHNTATAVTVHRPPALVRQLARAEAINYLLSDQGGWSRTIGTGDSEREATGRGLAALREQVRLAYGRRVMHRAV